MSPKSVPRDEPGGPLNLTDSEVEYLWELMKEEIGKEETWESEYQDEARSLHTKVRRLYYGEESDDL